MQKMLSLFGRSQRFFSVAQKFQEKREKKELTELIEFLTRKEKFLLRDFKDMVDSYKAKSGQSFIQKIFGGKQDDGAEMLEFANILAAVKEEELLDHTLINSLYKKENIASASRVEQKKVDQMLERFIGLKSMAFYLMKLKKKNEPMPNSHKEMMERYREEATMTREEKLKSLVKVKDIREYKMKEDMKQLKRERELRTRAKRVKAQLLIRPDAKKFN